MLVTVPDAGLHELLASQAVLLQMWPDAAREVITLLQVLRLAVPSLADALVIGLITLIGQGPQSAVVLGFQRATVTAIGRDADGTQVIEPCAYPERISRLEIHDVAVEGLSALAVRPALTVRR